MLCRLWVLPSLAALVLLLGALPADGGGESMYDPVFREGKASDLLVGGTPSLYRGNLDAFIDLTEAAFDVAIPADQEQALRDTLEIGFEAAGGDKREAFLTVVRPAENLRERLRQKDDVGARAGFETFRRAIDQRLQDLPKSRASALLGALLTRRHEAVWPGTPEIHGVAADAYLELAVFVTSLGRNEAVEPTPGQRDALRRELDGVFRAKDPALRERLRQAHRLWIFTKARWRASDEARRFAMRWEGVKVVARALPPEHLREVTPGSTLADYAREAADVAEHLGAFDALTNVARTPEIVMEAVGKGLEIPRDLPETILLYR